MKFVDEAVVDVYAGNGGDGCMSFRREKFVPRGGPDGGNGGRGGSIVFLGDVNFHTLLEVKVQKTYRAQRGRHGRGKKQFGKSGEDRVIRVPVGTVIHDVEREEPIGELIENGQFVMAAKGGRGGRGNAEFATSTHQAPREFERGGAGEKKRLRLELKLLADVGLVGLPNAGKSTLLGRISKARPKVADYPFTTLFPNLGVVPYGDYGSFVVADLPGLIEGASRGAGLGHQFLRHIERTQVLLFLLDASDLAQPDAFSAYGILRGELEKHDASLLHRDAVVALNKIDAAQDSRRLAALRGKFKRVGVTPKSISAFRGDGVKELVYDVGRRVEQKRLEQSDRSAA